MSTSPSSAQEFQPRFGRNERTDNGHLPGQSHWAGLFTEHSVPLVYRQTENPTGQ